MVVGSQMAWVPLKRVSRQWRSSKIRAGRVRESSQAHASDNKEGGAKRFNVFAVVSWAALRIVLVGTAEARSNPSLSPLRERFEREAEYFADLTS